MIILHPWAIFNMKKIMSLEEAKKILERSKIFLSYDEKRFNLALFGKYMPNITISLPREWRFMYGRLAYLNWGVIPTLDGFYKYKIPYDIEITYHTKDIFKQYVQAIGIDFKSIDDHVNISFGDFVKTKNGKYIFFIKEPWEAKHLLVDARFGEPGKRGYYEENARKVCKDLIWYKEALSNNGRYGHDYWVMPVDYTNNENVNMSEILLEMKEYVNTLEKAGEVYLQRLEERKEEARKNIEELKSKLDEWNSILEFSEWENIFIVDDYSIARGRADKKGEIFENKKYDSLKETIQEGIQRIKEAEIWRPKMLPYVEKLKEVPYVKEVLVRDNNVRLVVYKHNEDGVITSQYMPYWDWLYYTEKGYKELLDYLK